MSLFGLGACKGTRCGAFGGANPSNDTVRVQLPGDDKENVAPTGTQAEFDTKIAEAAHLAAEEDAKEQQRLAEERARRETEALARQEAEERAKREAEEFARAEAERIALQQQRLREAEEDALEEQRRAMEMEEERRRAEEEAAAAEERRLAMQAAEEQRRREEEAAAAVAKEKVDSFLKAHGFAGVNAKRTKMMKSKYALHSAVKHRDAEMVALLLRAGANPDVTNSAGQTPQQLAQKSKDDALIAALTVV